MSISMNITQANKYLRLGNNYMNYSLYSLTQFFVTEGL